jgi:hypothetical protein
MQTNFPYLLFHASVSSAGVLAVLFDEFDPDPVYQATELDPTRLPRRLYTLNQHHRTSSMTQYTHIAVMSDKPV